MSFRIAALFVDNRREFPHRFAESLWPEIQFTSFDRVAKISDAFQKHLMIEFNICFISDQIKEPLADFFTDIGRLGRHSTCIFVKIVTGKVPELETNNPSEIALEVGFDLAIHEEPSKIEYQALKEKLGIVWHKMELSRRSNDLDGSVNLLMRLIDGAAAQKKRGREVTLQHGVTSLMRMHAEFDQKLFDDFLNRLSLSFEQARPETKNLKSVPLPLLKKSLPALSEEGYLGVSNRVFRMLVDHFGEDLLKEDQVKGLEVSTAPAPDEILVEEQFDWGQLEESPSEGDS